MQEVNGKYNTAKVYTDVVDEKSLQQIKTLCDQEFTSGAKIALCRTFMLELVVQSEPQ